MSLDFDPHIRLDRAQSAELRLHRDNAERLFEDSGAREWIKTLRVTTPTGKLDLFATSEVLGVPVVFDPVELPVEPDFVQHAKHVDGMVVGLRPDKLDVPLTIYISPGKPSYTQLHTYGHEVGHIFLQAVQDQLGITEMDYHVTEAFCEQFGREMALDRDTAATLRGQPEAIIVEIMQRFDTGHMTALYQLIAAGKLPRSFMIDVGIGNVSNPYYSGKVNRRVVCYDCELHVSHDYSKPSQSYDLSRHNWGGWTPFTNCEPGVTSEEKQYAFRELNIAYSRWTDADDALMLRAIEREKQYAKFTQKALAQDAIQRTFTSSSPHQLSFEFGDLDDDIPF